MNDPFCLECESTFQCIFSISKTANFDSLFKECVCTLPLLVTKCAASGLFGRQCEKYPVASKLYSISLAARPLTFEELCASGSILPRVAAKFETKSKPGTLQRSKSAGDLSTIENQAPLTPANITDTGFFEQTPPSSINVTEVESGPTEPTPFSSITPTETPTPTPKSINTFIDPTPTLPINSTDSKSQNVASSDVGPAMTPVVVAVIVLAILFVLIGLGFCSYRILQARKKRHDAPILFGPQQLATGGLVHLSIPKSN